MPLPGLGGSVTLQARSVASSSHSKPGLGRSVASSASSLDHISRAAAAAEEAAMVRKLALASLFFNASEGSQCLSSSAPMSAASFSTAATWQWPSCAQARTRSFRGDNNSPEIVSMRHVDTSSKREEQEGYKTSMNPAYVVHDCYSSSLSDSSVGQSLSLSTAPAPAEPAADEDEDEAIIHGLRSSTTRRLLFEPESTSSIVNKTKKEAAFGGATALAIESADPYGDFRRSMEEMVLSHGADDDWAWLEEMLGWYLRANGKRTHGLIVGAFVDLLVALASSSAPSPAVCSSSLKPSRHLILEAAKIGEHPTQTE